MYRVHMRALHAHVLYAHVQQNLCVICMGERRKSMEKIRMEEKSREPKQHGRLYYRLKENIEISLLALPGLILLLLFEYWPLYGVIIAFKDYNPRLGIIGSPSVGLENFKFFFLSQDAGRIMRNTLSYSVCWLVLGIVCSVTLAVLFYNIRSAKALKVYNTIVILPKFMSSVLIAYIVYALLCPSYGIVNQIIEAFGGEAIQWYNEAKYWPVILTITRIWSHVGMDSIIYYASLVGLDSALLEAAELDGATSFQKAWHVMVPHLTPTIVVMLILGIGGLFSGDFGLFYQVTKDQGVLYPTTDIINTYTYRALIDGSVEKSAAVGLFQSVAGFILVVGSNLIVRKISPEDSLF